MENDLSLKSKNFLIQNQSAWEDAFNHSYASGYTNFGAYERKYCTCDGGSVCGYHFEQILETTPITFAEDDFEIDLPIEWS